METVCQLIAFVHIFYRGHSIGIRLIDEFLAKTGDSMRRFD